ncbi:EamA family transporter RarD [Fervidibacillus halotolerans]|uniref:EamA family transporter RarD n=1 Tax=Fervidibacillus halotolerans TaxID=2980027 RepID=A0A9E8LY34_9BACI|nr:EamA family transporter RarD [Fervidibacillus halotolerans]WAA11691.1 EamA family transporter RarD [Fervidibacillus halotolerans]
MQREAGVIYAVLAYCLWGFLPIYWKLIDHVSSDEILTHRIIWSFVFSILLLVVINGRHQIMDTIRSLRKDLKQVVIIFTASMIITTNWFVYIWAVNAGHVTDASLGYYMNPLVSVLFGVIFFKERLNRTQSLSFLLASIGVIILTVSHGSFPLIAFGLAITFGFYGLLKKLVQMDALTGLAIETFFVVPVAFGYFLYLQLTGRSAFLSGSLFTDIVLIGAGLATLLPLLFFAKGVQRIPLYYVGILQYIAPTLMLLLGVFLYHESFSTVQFASFSFIWLALIIFTYPNIKALYKKRQKGEASM